MKKSRKRIHLKNIRLRERMLLIYIIGGIIPFIGTSIYVNSHAGTEVLDASKAAQEETVSFLSTEMSQFMSVAERISGELCGDRDLLRIMEADYEEGSFSEQDKEEIEKLRGLQKNYQEYFADFVIYTENQMIFEMQPFALLTLDEQREVWYRQTMQSGEKGFWGYYGKEEERQVQYSRLVKNSEGTEIGILAFRINTQMMAKQMEENSADVLLIHADGKIVQTNLPLNRINFFLIKQISDFSKVTETISVTRNVDEYLLTYRKVTPSEGLGGFMVLCIQDYREIKGALNRISLNTYFFVGLSLVVSVVMIVWFSNAFQMRLKALRRQMFLVANGRYEAVEPIVGNDEIAEIYQEVEKMMGDIQDLTTNIVEEKVQKEKLHTRQKEVEFKMLASQINPHFLYNTLETIRMKARVNGQKEIEDLVKMLAKIMRRNIQVSNQMVSLRSEIELVENYLKIQEYRFGDRIVSQVVINPEVDLERKVMPLIIQPFVENAFVHGLEALTEQGKLVIEITQDEADVIIYVRDNGVGMPYYKLAELRHTLHSVENVDQAHIGINNVNQRLKIQYGDRYEIQINSSEADGTVIEIHIPQNP